jgi:hypothetical protein
MIDLFTSSSSLSAYVGLAKSRVRRLYLPFGDGFFLTMDVPGVDGTVGAGVVIVVFSTVGGIRCVGVDDPNATTVDLACKTRLIRAELVNATIIKRKICIFVILYLEENILGLGRNND